MLLFIALDWTSPAPGVPGVPSVPAKILDCDYTAHAIVTTKAPFLQRGVTVVLFESRATPPSTSGDSEWVMNGTVLKDGIGEISVPIRYNADRYKEDPGPPKLEWRLLGYAPLSSGAIGVE